MECSLRRESKTTITFSPKEPLKTCQPTYPSSWASSQTRGKLKTSPFLSPLTNNFASVLKSWSYANRTRTNTPSTRDKGITLNWTFNKQRKLIEPFNKQSCKSVSRGTYSTPVSMIRPLVAITPILWVVLNTTSSLAQLRALGVLSLNLMTPLNPPYAVN